MLLYALDPTSSHFFWIYQLFYLVTSVSFLLVFFLLTHQLAQESKKITRMGPSIRLSAPNHYPLFPLKLLERILPPFYLPILFSIDTNLIPTSLKQFKLLLLS